jgi:murein DD-endopeptidase MepM/ murein hydrolase activator NlpD
MARFIVNSTTGKRVKIIAITPGNIALALAFLVSALSLAVAVTIFIFSRAYKNELTLNKHLSGVVAQEMAAKSDVEARSLNRKVKFLVDEFARVRSYEKLIKSKVSALGSLLENILELDHTLLEHHIEADDSDLKPSSDKSSSSLVRTRSGETGVLEEGIGGGVWNESRNTEISSRASRPTIIEPTDTVSRLERSIELLNNIPIGAPLDGRYTSGFGRRRSPFSARRWHFHRGLDIAVARRSPVVATADGVVVFAAYRRGYGRTIKIDHGNGIKTVFGHLQKILVKKGQKICRGQRIGQVGTSGRATGPHLHYEVSVNGVPKNPKRFVELAELLRLANI